MVLMGAAFSVPAADAADIAGVNISGFVDVSYSDADDSNSTFSLDEIEVDVQKQLSENISLRTDINYRAVDADTAGDDLSFEELVEQGYVTIKLDNVGSGLDLTLGKFNAPIGFELLDPVDMYQFSHALVFDNGLPTNLTGVMGAYNLNDMIDIAAYVVNGWDNNTDNNQSKTVGGRIGINAMPGVAIGLSAISGTNETTTVNKRTVYDVDATITMVDNLTIGVELNAGSEENANSLVGGSGDGDWTAYLIMGHYDLDDTYGVTLRYDSFHDEHGSRLGNSLDETQSAFTVAGTMVLGDGAGLLAEWRRLDSDQNVFNNSTEDSSDTFAVEFTYSF